MLSSGWTYFVCSKIYSKGNAEYQIYSIEFTVWRQVVFEAGPFNQHEV